MKEGDESGEFDYYKGNPSPLEGLVIWCRSAHCHMVLPYHETKWREKTDEDVKWFRENHGLGGFCPPCWAMVQALKEEQEEDDSSD